MSSLPVILVSAKSEAAASHIITELIADSAGEGEGGSEGGEGARVWRIMNKYYRADVRLVPVAEGAPPRLPAPDGLLLYLAEDECSVERAEARLAAGGDAQVRVLAAECAHLPDALRAWAARHRLEPVPLRAAPDHAEPGGVAAVRAALHAHAWPGLQRHADPDRGEGDGDEEQSARWAEALGSLGGAAAAVRALSGAERLAAAEHVVAAFCRALGEDIDSL